MKKVHILLAIVFVVPILVLGFSTDRATAANEPVESITLSPVSRKYTIDAGGTVKDEMTIVNDGAVDYDFTVYGRPYTVTDLAYTPDFTKVAKMADAYGWAQFSQVKYHLKAGKSMTVPFSLSVPKNATPGGHYGVLFAETQPADGDSGAASVARKKRVGMLLYVTVNGAVTKVGSVQSTSIPFWQVAPPLRVTSRVDSTGNTDITDDTNLVVKDVFGNTKFSQAKQFTILPNQPREVPFEWADVSWFGLYRVTLTQTVLGKITTDSGYVLMMPRFLPLIALVICGAGGIYAWFHSRKSKK